MVHLATGGAGNDGPAAVARGRGGGLKCGNARVEKLSPEERLALARKAVLARWNRSLRQRTR